MMREKRVKIEGTYVKQGLTIFVAGLGLIIAFYMINNIPDVKELFSKLNGILMPFYIGLVIAYLLCPIYNGTVRILYSFNKGRFKKPINDLRISKFFATIVALSVFIAAVVGFIMMIIPDLWESIMSLVLGIDDTIDKVQIWIRTNIEENPELVALLEGKLENFGENALSWVQDKMLPKVETIISGLSVGVLGTLSTVLDVFIALIISVYILNSKEMFMAQGKKLVLSIFSKERADSIFELGIMTNQTFGGFINGKIIDSVIIGLMCFIIMSLLQIPMAMLISFIIGVTNIIPFFGPFIGAVPSSILLLLLDPVSALKFIIMVLVLQQIDGNIIGPKILGKTTKLASFWVMFAILVGGGLFGFVGMIVSVPLFAVLYTYIGRAINNALKRKDIPTETLIYADYDKYHINKEDLFGKERFEHDREDKEEASQSYDN